MLAEIIISVNLIFFPLIPLLFFQASCSLLWKAGLRPVDRLSPDSFVSDPLRGLVLPDFAVFLVAFQEHGTRQPCQPFIGMEWLDHSRCDFVRNS